MSCNKKLEGFEFYEKILKQPKLIVAPMVDQSELAWRMLCRKYGAELCYTPMFHASVFIRDQQYRTEALKSCSDDRPLIFQFCANAPETLLKAGLLAQDHCDAIDLNLGCPQAIARRGHYGAFLQDDWDLIRDMISLCHQKLSIPITSKIRVFPSMEKTVRYAKMLEGAGSQILTVHGRTKEQRGANTGLAEWKYVKEIKKSLTIPVFSNGNIQYLEDIQRCLDDTGCDAVMTAEGNLHNPALFTGKMPLVYEISQEYLEFVEKYPPCPLSYVRGHIFKICVHALQRHTDIRNKLGNSKSLHEIKDALIELKTICEKECQNDLEKKENDLPKDDLPFPHWICQPYVRPASRPVDKKAVKRPLEGDKEATEHCEISKKKLKKLLKKHGQLVHGKEATKEQIEEVLKLERNKAKQTYAKCVQCGSPSGERCVFLMCKTCCRTRTKQVNVNCPRHQKLRQSRT